MEFKIPSLIEHESKYIIKHALRTSRDFKDKYINIAVNIILFLLFTSLIGCILFYKYKGKPNEEEIIHKNNIKKKYFFEKLQKYQIDKQKENQRLITNLPVF